MDQLHDLAEKVAEQFATRSKAMSTGMRFVKAVAIIGLSVVAGAAHFLHTPIWETIGIAASVGIGVAGVFLLLTDQDASAQLDLARQGIERVRSFDQRIAQFESTFNEQNIQVSRALELYAAMRGMRKAVEESLSSGAREPAKIIEACLKVARNNLIVSMGFQIDHTWTICVYKTEREDSGRALLKCIAHARTIECKIADARTWLEGVGPSGIAYSQGNDVIVPDMLAPELGSIFNVGANGRRHDRERYRSIAAIPILVASNPVPWGVAVATSDQSDHFNVTNMSGVATVEPLRALAAMCALAVQASAAASPITADIGAGAPILVDGNAAGTKNEQFPSDIVNPPTVPA